MNFVALRMLFGDKLKYFGLIAGMTFAAMMMAQQASIFTGLKSQTGTFIREMSGVDLWVMDDQVKFSEDQQPISDAALYRVRGIEGVEWAVPMFKGWIKARLPDGTRTQVIVIGLDDATLIGAPANMVDGELSDLRKNNGVIIDIRDTTTKLGMKRGGDEVRAMAMGERISINDQDAEVVGMFKGSPSFFWDPVVYTTYSRALRYAPKERNLMSFVLVRTAPGVDVAEVKRRIEETTPYTARTTAEFEAITAAYILKSTGILVNFGIAVGLGLLVGLLVTGQTFFNFTLDNLRHFASLKAMGASAWTLIRMVFVQVFTVTGISFGLGIGLAAVIGTYIAKTDLAFLMPWQVPVFTLVALLAIAFISGVLSLIKVLRLEPAVVFKA